MSGQHLLFVNQQAILSDMSEIKEIKAIGVHDYDHWLEPKSFTYKPQALRPYDIDIKIIACGICGSDIHCANGDWGRPYAPIAVGHEIIGNIVALGDDVDKTKFHIGDRVGVGAQCDSCGECWRCSHDHQNNCESQVGTYGGRYPSGINSQGGYANYVRVNNKFAFKIPDGLETIHAAPLMCGGITGFRPLLTAGVKKGTKVGVSGIGGIGHMTILFAKALGAEVTAISRSDKKREVAKKLGVDHYVSTSDPKFPDAFKDSLDVIVNTASTFSEGHVKDVMSMMRPDGKFIFITAPPITEKLQLEPFFLLRGSYLLGGSAIGSPSQIEYMLNLAAEKGIKPWIETIDINEKNVSTAWKRMEDGDVRFRFVLTGYDKCFA
ncbi:DEKNAAC100073 [Brettanomyces naardenensis]|uniref:DEKNAAC100073 n=1 Tax=Brettanomyces naardenensis TaxID=13370 RepID=A0A448YG60_BRENA|nr:DEKNAAC100073 [Brettanomyces naardenensis]